MKFKEIIERIEGANRIIIMSHINPDGDSLGAGLGLLHTLNRYNEIKKKEDKDYMDKVVRFVLQDPIPRNLKFLEGSELVERSDHVVSKYRYDLAICVDAATSERLGSAQKHLEESDYVINIDHHVSNTRYGDLNYVEDISSTSEIIYNLVNEMKIEITRGIGEALYTGLVNDTGNFSHSNVTSKTLLMAANLVENGVDNSKIVREFYSNKNMPSLKLMGVALQEMVYEPQKKFTYFYLSNEKLKSVGGLEEDTEGIVNLISSYCDSEVALFLKEKEDGTIKGSMRSKHDVDVNKIASMFGGGGHIKAAGFSVNDISVENIIKKIIEKL